jgi:4-hydroxyphenylpyruvate dioxygenase
MHWQLQGFHEFADFTEEDVDTANGSIMCSSQEVVMLPLDEPMHVTKRWSRNARYRCSWNTI